MLFFLEEHVYHHLFYLSFKEIWVKHSRSQRSIIIDSSISEIPPRKWWCTLVEKQQYFQVFGFCSPSHTVCLWSAVICMYVHGKGLMCLTWLLWLKFSAVAPILIHSYLHTQAQKYLHSSWPHDSFNLWKCVLYLVVGWKTTHTS